MNDYLDGELAQDTAAVAANETEQCGLGLEEPGARAKIDGQMEQQVAVDDVGVSFALAAPYASQTASNAAP